MDTRKYGSAFIKPDDVRDGPRQETIIAVLESQKFDCLQLEFESGDTLLLNKTTTRALQKAYGLESDDWRDKVIELSLGHYTDRKVDPPVEKETVSVRPISTRQPSPGNGSTPPRPSVRDLPSDEIPF